MTDIALPGQLNTIDVNRAARPMLSRDADSMYWMSRYVERAEHVARLLLVNANLLTDTGDLAPHLQERQWIGVLSTLRISAPPPGEGPLGPRLQRHLAFSAENPNGLVNCLSRARENARGIRENISAEMWESLNALYWSICSEEAVVRFEESPDEFYRSIMTGSLLFQGLTDQTLSHDQGWMFTQLGKLFERIDLTCRVIEIKYQILQDPEFLLETPLRNIHWMAVLRSCCSIEAYRRHYIGDLDPHRVAGFLILQRTFPRSIRYCVEQCYDAVAAVRGSARGRSIDPAERILGRLTAQLEYAEMGEILRDGLVRYLQGIQSQVADAAAAVQKAYFLH